MAFAFCQKGHKRLDLAVHDLSQFFSITVFRSLPIVAIPHPVTYPKYKLRAYTQRICCVAHHQECKPLDPVGRFLNTAEKDSDSGFHFGCEDINLKKYNNLAKIDMP